MQDSAPIYRTKCQGPPDRVKESAYQAEERKGAIARSPVGTLEDRYMVADSKSHDTHWTSPGHLNVSRMRSRMGYIDLSSVILSSGGAPNHALRRTL